MRLDRPDCRQAAVGVLLCAFTLSPGWAEPPAGVSDEARLASTNSLTFQKRTRRRYDTTATIHTLNSVPAVIQEENADRSTQRDAPLASDAFRPGGHAPLHLPGAVAPQRGMRKDDSGDSENNEDWLLLPLDRILQEIEGGVDAKSQARRDWGWLAGEVDEIKKQNDERHAKDRPVEQDGLPMDPLTGDGWSPNLRVENGIFSVLPQTSSRDTDRRAASDRSPGQNDPFGDGLQFRRYDDAERTNNIALIHSQSQTAGDRGDSPAGVVPDRYVSGRTVDSKTPSSSRAPDLMTGASVPSIKTEPARLPSPLGVSIAAPSVPGLRVSGSPPPAPLKADPSFNAPRADPFAGASPFSGNPSYASPFSKPLDVPLASSRSRNDALLPSSGNARSPSEGLSLGVRSLAPLNPVTPVSGGVGLTPSSRSTDRDRFRSKGW